MLRIFSLVAIIALASGCASQPSSKTATAQNVSAKNSSEKVADNSDTALKCKYVVQTGTRFGTRICMRKKDWDAREKKAAENAREEIQRASLNAQQTQNMPGAGK